LTHQGWFTWDASWTWGITLIACTVALHVSCVVLAALGLRRLRIARTRGKHRLLDTTVGAIIVIVAVAWLLAVAHAVECTIWAAAYLHLGGVENPADAMLYSIVSLTTRGTSGLVLLHHWLMMGAIESIDGLLLFGISTAFLFHVMRGWLPDFTLRRS
jgi:ABC-type maltose transport system permease subunit